YFSGYRRIFVSAMQSLPLELDSDLFDFDTEIIIQLLNGQLRIVEHPLPTFYGDEISRVNGLKYAKNIVRAVIENSFHRSGIFYQERFDILPQRDPSTHETFGREGVQNLLPSAAKTSLM